MLFSPTIGVAIAARYWFLWVLSPGCRTTSAIDLRTLDRHRDAAVTSLIPAPSCLSYRPNAPFADLVRLSRTSIAERTAVARRNERNRRNMSRGIWEIYNAKMRSMTRWTIGANTC